MNETTSDTNTIFVRDEETTTSTTPMETIEPSEGGIMEAIEQTEPAIWINENRGAFNALLDTLNSMSLDDLMYTPSKKYRTKKNNRTPLSKYLVQ